MKIIFTLALALAATAALVCGQFHPQSETKAQPQAQSRAETNQPAKPDDGRTRVFITDSESWQMGGGLGGGSVNGTGGIAGAVSGGARPQNAEIMKTFGDRCPAVTITIKKEMANYIVILEHEGGKEFFQHDNKVAVFNGIGDMVYSGSTRSLGNAVKDACETITREMRREERRAER